LTQPPSISLISSALSSITPAAFKFIVFIDSFYKSVFYLLIKGFSVTAYSVATIVLQMYRTTLLYYHSVYKNIKK